MRRAEARPAAGVVSPGPARGTTVSQLDPSRHGPRSEEHRDAPAASAGPAGGGATVREAHPVPRGERPEAGVAPPSADPVATRWEHFYRSPRGPLSHFVPPSSFPPGGEGKGVAAPARPEHSS